jgi:hypothetical protein
MINQYINRAILILLCFSMLTGCSGPWKGKIIDIETKEPLEGAVVLAVWERVYRTPYGPSSSFYEAIEVVTNKAGEFVIPSYTPIDLLPLISNMRGPIFTIFKPGYGSLTMALGKYLTGEAEKKLEPYSGKLSGYMISVSEGFIQLQKLRTREERKKLFPGLLMYDEANKKAKNYRRLLNVEAIEIGLAPYPTMEDEGK